MPGVLLTQNSTFIIGPVAKILGYLIDGIFKVLNLIGIPNIGLAIIFFTIIIYLFLTPLTFKQQKFSKLQAKMSPELQAIQAKYKGKKDNDSVMMMNQETQAVYAKYGVSPSGSCVQLLIQMPILFALYRVIYAIPAYVGQVREAFFPLVDNLIKQPGSADFLKNTENFKGAGMFVKQFTNDSFINNVGDFVQNTYIDVLNRASTAEWGNLVDKFPGLKGDVNSTLGLLNRYNNFLGINIGDSPWYTMKDSFAKGSYFLVVAAVLIPLLAALTQWINTKLIPVQKNTGNEQADQMANQMKMMNTFMPIMSAWFCFTLPAGMGIYWIASAVVRSIQQVIINKHIDKMDIDSIIEKNKDKAAKKIKKKGITAAKLQEYANVSTKNIRPSDTKNKATVNIDETKVEQALNARKEIKPGSLAAKANLVKEYNESNNRK